MNCYFQGKRKEKTVKFIHEKDLNYLLVIHYQMLLLKSYGLDPQTFNRKKYRPVSFWKPYIVV